VEEPEANKDSVEQTQCMKQMMLMMIVTEEYGGRWMPEQVEQRVDGD
jgi:hypothetical protein